MEKPTNAREVDGWMEGAALDWIEIMARQQELVVEVGVWKGRSAFHWSEYCPGKVIGVDHWLGSESGGERDSTHKQATEDREGLLAEVWANLGGFVESGKLCLLEMDTATAARFLGGQIAANRESIQRRIPSKWGVPQFWTPRKADLIFIDAGHSCDEVAADIATWLPLVKPGGILCGHDSCWESVREALDEFLPGWTHGGGSIWHYQHPL